MIPIGKNIWSYRHHNKVAGLIALNTRMTICRLDHDALVVHSPIPLDDATRASVESLGEVKALIAPNQLHHLFMGPWLEAYPNAISFGARGLAKKRPDLKFTHELGGAFNEAFGDSISRFAIDGMPRVNESIFFHKESGTLIVTDLCFYMPDSSGLSSLYAGLMKFKKTIRSPLIFRAAIKDKAAFRASLAPLRDLAPTQLSMCHDHVITDNAAAALRGVLRQLEG